MNKPVFRFLASLCRRAVNRSHHVVEDEARVRQFEVFEQAVELPAVQRTPRAVEVVSGLRLLPRVVVVLKLERNRDVSVTKQKHEQHASLLIRHDFE